MTAVMFDLGESHPRWEIDKPGGQRCSLCEQGARGVDCQNAACL